MSVSVDALRAFASTLRDAGVHELPLAVIAVAMRELGAPADECLKLTTDSSATTTTTMRPTRSLVRIYRELAQHGLGRVGGLGWNDVVTAAVADVTDASELRAVSVLIDRSVWLAHDGAPLYVRCAHAAPPLALVEPGFAITVNVTDTAGIHAALSSDVPKRQRASLLAQCIVAAAKLNDAQLVARCIAEVPGALTRTTIGGALAVLHAAAVSTNESDVARALVAAVDVTHLEHFAPIVTELAALAHLSGDVERRDALLAKAREVMFSNRTSHRDRFAGGVSLVNVAFRTGHDVLLRECALLVEKMKLFTDTFITARHYPIHQVLVVEIIAEAFLNRTYSLSSIPQW